MFHSIYPYSRREAIRDGVMLDISDEAKDPDFKIPVAVTYSYLEYLVSSKGLEQEGQAVAERMYDLLMMRHAAAANR
jgi:hypothetical protein